MTAMLRVGLFAALVAFSAPSIAAGQEPSVDSLRRRVDLLEQRVRELEARLTGEPSRVRGVAASPGWRNLENWRRLRRGMTMDDVRALLGDPERVDASVFTYWHYAGMSNVYFDWNSRLDGWSEPQKP